MFGKQNLNLDLGVKFHFVICYPPQSLDLPGRCSKINHVVTPEDWRLVINCTMDSESHESVMRPHIFGHNVSICICQCLPLEGAGAL